MYFPTSEFPFKLVLGKCYSVALLENNNLTFFPLCILTNIGLDEC